MPDPIQIYVDNVRGDDHPPAAGDRPARLGDEAHPVRTADKAFSLLPDHWTGDAEIIFVPRPDAYTIETDAIYLGTPVGSEASSLVIRAGGNPYERVQELTATAVVRDTISFAGPVAADSLMGHVLGRLNSDGEVTGAPVSIRGNTGSADASDATLELQRPLTPAARVGERFAVERPRVRLAPQQTLNITSHDGRSPNLTLIGIEFAPVAGAGLNFLNVRAMCDTCAFYLQAETPTAGRPATPVILYVHTDSRIQGGIEGHPSRFQAGVFIHSNNRANLVRAVRGGVLAGHLTFDNIVVQTSQGGWFVPKTLEARNAPIQILTGGSAMAQLSSELGANYAGWGTVDNKARIRDVAGDGLRIFNGGSLNAPAGPIYLDIYGCTGDGIRLDGGGWGFFGPQNPRSTVDTGLVSSGSPNRGFGMNVLNASRAVIGRDTLLQGELGQVALDGVRVGDTTSDGWARVIASRWVSNDGLSLVRLNQ